MTQASDPRHSSAADADAVPPSVRGLAPALAFCARELGASNQPEQLQATTPLEQGELPLDRLSEAVRKLGLVSQQVETNLVNASSLACPLVGITDTGVAVVIADFDRRDDTADIVVFSGSAPTRRQVSLRKLSRGMVQPLILIARADQEAGQHGEEADAAQQNTHWFWSAVRRFKGAYAQVIVASFVVNMLGIASPLFVMNVYDRVIPNLAIPTLWALASGVVVALVFDFILKMLRSRVVDETGRRIDMAVSGRVFDHLLVVKSDARSRSTGVLASHIRDFDNVRDALTSSTVVALTDAAFIVIFLLVLYWIVGVLVLVPTIAAILVIAVTLGVQMPMDRALKAAQSDSARRHGILVETLLSIDAVKRTGAASFLRRRFDHSVAEASRSATTTRFWSHLNSTFIQSASQGVSVVLIVWGVFLVLQGQISVGALIAANILSGRVLAPLASVAGTLSKVQQAKHSYKSVDGLMHLPSEWSTSAPTRALVSPTVKAERLSYTYPGQTVSAIEGLSFEVRAGDRLGIIGRVGSGKSTLGRLLCGLGQPTAGKLFIDGVDVLQLSPVALRRFVGVVPQEPDLVSGTLLDNLMMCEPTASPDEVARVLELVGLDDLARHHPRGLAMPITERGENLSGGQRACLAVAQTLIRRPQVIFLDEPTAALDVLAEKHLLSSLERLSNEDNVTLIIATHRRSTLSVVNRVLVIDGGELVALGPKEKVLKALGERADSNTAMKAAAALAKDEHDGPSP